MSDKSISRRSILRSLGYGTALAPFIPALSARAQGAGVRRRLLLVFTPNAPIIERWKPSGSETSFTLGEGLRPLDGLKQHLIVITGLDKAPGRNGGPGSGHAKGIAHTWTAAANASGGLKDCGGGSVGFADGMSVDQHIANTIAPTVKTRFKSLEFAVQPGGTEPCTRMIYRGPRQPVEPMTDPYAAFDRIFGMGVTTNEGERLQILAERRSVIDRVRGDLTTIRSRIGTDDQKKMDAHLNAIREVESRLQTGGGTSSCKVPARPAKLEHNANGNYPKVMDLQMDLVTLALACDMTRVASLQMSRAVSGATHSWLGFKDNAHAMGHYKDDNTGAKESVHKMAVWYSQRFADLLNKMKAVSDDGGGTLLDNTMVVWAWELGKSNNHQTAKCPFIVAGTAGGYFKTGRFLDYAGGPPHSPLLVSMCHAMGVTSLDKFGTLTVGGGASGSPGPLPRLRV